MIEASVQASGIKTIVRTSIIEKSRTKVENVMGGAWGGERINDSRTL